MSRLTPKVSVLMSAYNGSRYLCESIESILNQTFTDFEFIIIDDGSTDSTWKLLTEYADKDQRVRLFKNEENIGLTESLNKGLKLAEGEYIARQDADDVSLPERFEKQVTLLDKHPEFVLVSCNLELIDSEGSIIGKYQRACEPDLVPWYLLFYNRLAGHSQVMFRRKPALDLGGYSQIYPHNEDYELWCRLVKVGKITILSEVLLQHRMHNQSISFNKRLEQKAYNLNQVRHNIKKLIGEEIKLEEAEDLSRFWVGHWWRNHFPDSQTVGVLHSRLKEICWAYIQQNAQQNSSYDPQMSRQLRILIGQQFVCWIKVLSIRRSLLSKLRISLYAFAWHPLGVLNCWLREFGKVRLLLLRTLV